MYSPISSNSFYLKNLARLLADSGLLGLNLGVFVRYAVFNLILDRIQATLADKHHPFEPIRLKPDMIDPLIARGQERMTNATISHFYHSLS